MSKEKEKIQLWLVSKLKEIEDVNEQMISLKNLLLLQNHELKQRQEIVLFVEKTLRGFFPNCVAYLFGSSVNGLGFKGLSDVDIYLDLDRDLDLELDPKTGKQFGELIFSALKNNPLITNLEGVFNARVPIVRFVIKDSGFKCDLSWVNKMSVMNSRFLRLCQKADPR